MTEQEFKIRENLVNKAKVLVDKSMREKFTLSQDELENLRADIVETRFFIATEVLLPAAIDTIAKEIAYDDRRTREMGKYYKAYSTAMEEAGQEKDGSTKYKLKYNKSVAESFARNTIKMLENPASILYKEHLEAKAYESHLYQLLKSLDQVANALSAITRRKID